jgi:beta-lactamase class A
VVSVYFDHRNVFVALNEFTMAIRRRTLLAAVPLLVAGAACAEEATPALKAYEQAVGGRIGLLAQNLTTGAEIAWRADERFAMFSTFKASLVACVLARVDRGEESLDRIVGYDQTDIVDYAPVAKANLAKGSLFVAELCKAAVELSDNTCANLLLARIGGPPALTAFWRSTGDPVTRLEHNEPLSKQSKPGDDATTPAAMSGNLRRFILGDVLAPASRALLVYWMRNCKTGTDLLRAGLPSAWSVADKTGSNSKDVLGDIAVAWPEPARPLTVAVYAEGGSAPAPQLRRVFAEIGKLIGQRLS